MKCCAAAGNTPGVEVSAVGDSLPPDRQGDADTFGIEGQTLAPGEINPIISHADVGPNYFRALGIPLVTGRYFTSHDNQDAAPVAIVSEGFVRRFLPNQEALGKRFGYSGSWMEIVGVVGNVKYMGLTTRHGSGLLPALRPKLCAAGVSGGAYVGRRRSPG